MIYKKEKFCISKIFAMRNLFLYLFLLSIFLFITSMPLTAQVNLTTSVKTVDNRAPVDGETINYTITLINTGDQPATNVVVTDTIPANLENFNLISSPNGLSHTPALPSDRVMTTNSFTITAAGGTQTIEFSADVIPGTAVGTEIINTAVITGDGGINFTLTAPTVKVTISNANLSSIKLVNGGSDPVSLAAGTLYTYTIEINNTGSETARHVSVFDVIPANVHDFVAVAVPPGSINLSLEAGADPLYPNGLLNIRDFNVPPGGSRTITFSVVINSPLPSGTVINNNASIDADGRTPVNISAPPVTVTSSPNLDNSDTYKRIIEIIDPSGPTTYTYISDVAGKPLFLDSAGNYVNEVVPGWRMKYEIKLTNRGNADSTVTELSDTLPGEVSYRSGTTTLNGAPFSDGSVENFPFDPANLQAERLVNTALQPAGTVKPFVSLANTNSAVITFEVDVVSPLFPGTTVGNTVNITNNEGEAVNRTDDIDVKSAPDFSTSTKVSDPVTVNPGDRFTYRITLNNTGTSNATGVTVYDNIPGDVTFFSGTLTIDEGSGPVVQPDPPTSGGLYGRGYIDLSGLTVNVGTPVVIEFDVTADGSITPGDIYNVAGVNSTQGVSYSMASTFNLPAGEYPIFSASTKSAADINGAPFYIGNPLNPGDFVVYTLTVNNTGSVPATNVLVRDPIPAGTIYIYESATGPGVNESALPGEIRWNLGTVEPLTSVVLTFMVRIEAGFDPSFLFVDNQATVECSEIAGTDFPSTPLRINVVQQPATAPNPPVNFDPDTNKEAIPDLASPGDEITYILNFGNYSGVNAEDITITDVIPAGTEFVPGSMEMTVNTALGPRLFDEGDLAALPPGSESATYIPGSPARVEFYYPLLGGGATGYQVRFKVRVLDDGSVVDGDTITNDNYNITTVVPGSSDNGSAVSVRVIERADFSTSTKSVLPAGPVTPGQTLTYTINITNTGDGSAGAVNFLDYIPASTTYVNDSLTISDPNTIIYNPGPSPRIEGQISNINPGQTVTVSFQVTVDAGPSGGAPILNDATITYTHPIDGLISAVTNQTANKIQNNPVLTISKTDGSDPVASGGNITYTINYGNTGNVTATGVVITDRVPLNTTFGSATEGGSYNPATGLVTWNVATPLLPAGSGSVSFTVQVSPSAVNGLLINNSDYKISATNTQSVNGATVTTTVDPGVPPGGEPVPSLTVSKSAADPLLGSQFSYNINVENDPNADYAYNLTIFDRLPDGVSFVSASVPPDSLIENPDGTTDLIFLDIKDLAHGESYGLSITVQMDEYYDDEDPTPERPVRIGDDLANTATAYLDDDPFGFGNKYTGSGSTSAVVQGIVLSKSANVREGQRATGVQDWPITYTLTVQNQVPQPINNVVITDTLRSEMDYLGNSSVPLNAGYPVVNPDGTITLKWTFATIGPDDDGAGPNGNETITYDAGIRFQDRYTGVKISDTQAVQNTADVRAVFPDPETGQNLVLTDTAEATVSAKYFAIYKSADRSNVVLGDIVKFTLEFEVSQYFPLSGIQIIDTLPNGLDYRNGSAVLDEGTPQEQIFPYESLSVVNSEEIITWNVGNLALGSAHTITFLAAVGQTYNQTSEPLLSGDGLTNNVEIRGFDDIYNLEHSDISSAGVSILGASFDKEIISINDEFVPTDPPTATVGDKITYRLTLEGPGGVDTGNILLRDYLPAGLLNSQVVSNPAANIRPGPADTSGFDPTVQANPGDPNSPGWSVLPNNGINWTVGTIGPSEIIQIEFDAIVQNDITDVVNAALYKNLGKANNAPTSGSPISFRDEVPIQYIIPDLTIEKDGKLSTDANYVEGPINGGGGANIDYRVTVTNSGDGPAFNIIVTDLVPEGISSVTNISDGGFYVAGHPNTPAGYAGIIFWGVENRGTSTSYPPTQSDSNGTLQLSGVDNIKELTYTGTIESTIGASNVLVNRATLETYNTQVTPGQGRIFEDGPENEGKIPGYIKLSDIFTVNIPSGIIIKRSNLTAPVTEPFRVGDVFQYIITVVAPGDRSVLPPNLNNNTLYDFDGSLYQASVTDDLDSLNPYLDFIAVNPDVANPGSSLANYNSGTREISWTIDNPVQPGQVYRLIVDVRVTNTASLPPGPNVTQRNTARLTYNRVDGSSPINPALLSYDGDNNPINTGDTVVDNNIRQPLLTIEKIADDTEVVGGQIVNYTINIRNTGNNRAYDVYVEDLLDPDLIYIPGSSSINIGGGDISLADGSEVSVSGGPGGETLNFRPTAISQLEGPFPRSTVNPNIIIKFQVRVNPLVGVGRTLPNDVYTRDGADTTHTYSSLPGTYSPDIERHYAPVTDRETLTVGNAGVSKRDAGSQTTVSNPSDDERATNGEIVTYTLEYSIPQFTTVYGATLEDNLPPGVTFISGSATGPALVSSGTGTVTFNNSVNPTEADPLVWTLGDIINNSDNTALFRVTYQVYINGNTLTPVPAGGDTLDNDFTFTFFPDATLTPGTEISASAEHTVTVIVPDVEGTKGRTTIPATPEFPEGPSIDSGVSEVGAGDWVGYSLTLTNEDLNASDAYDVIIIDNIPRGMWQTQPVIARAYFMPGNVPVTVGTPLNPPDPNEVAITGWNNTSGLLEITFAGPMPTTGGTTGRESLVIEYVTQVDTDDDGGLPHVNIGPGVTMDNSATLVEYSTLPVLSPDNRETFTVDSNMGTERVTTPDATVNKSVDKTDAAVGETVTYTVTLSTVNAVGHDITAHIYNDPGDPVDPTLIDIIPANVEITDLTVTVNGTTNPAVSISGSYPYGSNIISSLLVNPSFEIGPDTEVIFTIETRILNNPPAPLNNNRGDTFDNTGEFHFAQFPGETEVTASDNSGNVTITEPSLSISKSYLSIAPPTGGPADINSVITYQVSIENTGDSEAFDIFVRDALDPGLFFNELTSTVAVTAPADFTGSTPLADYDAGNVEFDFAGENGSDGEGLAPGETLVFTYEVEVADTAGAARELLNTANLDNYYSFDSTSTERRTYSDGSDNYTLTMVAPGMDKTVVNIDAFPPEVPSYSNEASAGERITYTITFPQPAIQANLYNPVFTDTVPDGLSVLSADSNRGAEDTFIIDPSVAGTLVTGYLSEIDPGEQVAVTITALVRSRFDNNLPIPVGTEFINTSGLSFRDLSSGGVERNIVSNNVRTVIRQKAGVTITPERIKNIRPGDLLIFPHTVTNTGNRDDTMDLTYTTTAGFIYDFVLDLGEIGVYEPGIDILLTDTDGDGIVDTGSLSPEESINILVIADIPGNTPAGTVETLDITATSSNDTGVSDIVRDTAGLVTEGPRLDVTKSVAPAGTQLPGTELTYTISYINLGPGRAANVIITDNIPDNTTYVANSTELSLDGGLTFNPLADALILRTEPDRLVITVGTMEMGQEAVFTFRVVINDGQ